MPATMEELGLYSEEPEATVDGITPDPADPAMAEVRFSDGRVATMPTSHAESMPQTPDPMAYGTPFGPPAAPPAAPDAGGEFSAGPGLGGADMNLQPDTLLAEEQAAAAAPPPETVPVGVSVGTGSAQ